LRRRIKDSLYLQIILFERIILLKYRNVIYNAAVILLYLYINNKETYIFISVVLSRASVIQGINKIIYCSENSFAYLFIKEIIKTDIIVPLLLPVSLYSLLRADIR